MHCAQAEIILGLEQERLAPTASYERDPWRELLDLLAGVLEENDRKTARRRRAA
ncbi:hypothetical protein PZ938_03030 [Luteipulveratus sp. YIM 133132]|uniref:hypothetical protein n=1 Tax=Luteipulveratus flavus TaxID=3031728 RepID=UPI0023B0C8B7|nr:hypothetical protein [Luteipulveratus sp. YIM 133132]MDE9364566.1 hypothetical protein [Luteipulveratus sp. YIM 133132]